MKIKLADADAAYIAGFIDGEGCITLRPHNTAAGTKVYDLVVTITNTNHEILVWIHAIFGGYLGYRPSKNPNHKHRWQLDVGNKNATNLIQAIYPWLKIKKGQADLALKFRETVLGKREAIKGVSEDLLVRRDGFYSQIRVLNRKGQNACLSN